MGQVDWGQVADFLNVVGGLGGLVAVVVVFWLKGTFVSKTEYDGDQKDAATAVATLHGRINLIEQTLVRIEAGLKAIPEVQELHRLALSVERLNGTVTAVQAKLEGFGGLMERVETMVNRHEDHLLSGDRK